MAQLHGSSVRAEAWRLWTRSVLWHCLLTMELATAVGPSGIIVGLDFSEKMLAVATENLERFVLRDNVRLVCGRAMELPFRDNTFDCATVGWGLRSLPYIPAGLQEMIRVVKPGGKVVSLDAEHPSLPVFKQFYWLYFKKVIPAIGRFWTRNREAYKYLYNSARTFPRPEELTEMFRQAGLLKTGYHNLAWGIVPSVTHREVQDLLALAYRSQEMEGQHPKPLLRTDRGSPNLEGGTKRLIRDLEMILSPGRADRPTDNARQERWYRTVQQEEIYLYATYPSLEIARASLAGYIEFYNERRPPSGLVELHPKFRASPGE